MEYIREYLANLGIMITVIYVVGVLGKQFMVSLDRKYSMGIITILAILAGWLSMFYGIHLGESVIFDLRFIPIILAALYARKSIYILIVGLGIGLVRFAFGVSEAAVVGAINMIVLAGVGAILAAITSKWTYRAKMWVTIITLNVLNATVIAIFGVIPFAEILPLIVMTVFPMNLLLSLFLVWMVNDLNREYHAKLDLLDKARKDSLTQLYNRRAFMDFYKKVTSSKKSYPISVVFVDIDFFKSVNDSYGHLVGDVVLQRVSERLVMGIGNSAIVGRYGGEEFIAVIKKCDKEAALKIMEKVRIQMAREPIQVEGHVMNITISAGIASSEDIHPNLLIKEADDALFIAKRNGRNRVFCGPYNKQLNA